MSIYATLWELKFPKYGDHLRNNEWVGVLAQAVPGFIGAKINDNDQDYYADFLPPPLDVPPGGEEELDRLYRAVVFVRWNTKKGTDKHPQKYLDPLLILSGVEYERIPFDELYKRLCDALKSSR